MTFAELIVKFGTEGVGKLKSEIKEVSQGFNDAEKSAFSFSNMVKSIATGNLLSDALRNSFDSVKNFASSIVQMGMAAETTNARFEALGMNANKTREFVSKVAAASTMTTNQLVDMAASLEMSGFNIYRVLPAFAKLADLVGTDTDKLQGMVRLLNVLKTGAKPDQELLQSLKMPTLLAEAGLKFNQGKLVGDVNAAMEAVIKIIEGKGSGVSKAMGKTFEAAYSSMNDQLNKIKESLGMKILEWAKPWVSALSKVLDAMVSGGVWDRVLNQFFNQGQKSNEEVVKGLTSKEGLGKIIDWVAKITAYIAFIPDYIKVGFQNIKPILTDVFNAIRKDPAMAGIISVLEQVGKYKQNQEQAEKYKAARFEMFRKGLIDSPQMADDAFVRRYMNRPQPVKDGVGKALSGFESINSMVDKMAKQNAMTMRGVAFNSSGGNVDGRGNVTKPGTQTGDPTDYKSEKQKTEKAREKQQKALDLIESHTRQTSEFTLRNATYGGGMLAAQGISETQLWGMKRGAGSPQINASNDIVRGIEKIVRGFQTSNSLNVNIRRS